MKNYALKATFAAEIMRCYFQPSEGHLENSAGGQNLETLYIATSLPQKSLLNRITTYDNNLPS